jgi:hypothetical protein
VLRRVIVQLGIFDAPCIFWLHLPGIKGKTGNYF